MSRSPFASRTALITGATGGLGFALAHELAAASATVIVHAPDRASGDAALNNLIEQGADRERLRLVVADFSRIGEVTELADELVRTVPALDLLVNNAAIFAPERRTRTPDGHEITFQINYLAPYLLTTALTPALIAARGRVVNVSSDSHRGASIGWTDLDRKKGYYLALPVYAQSKLALTMFTRTFADAHPGILAAISVNPGNLRTGMLRFYGQVGRPAAEAAAEIAGLCDPSRAVRTGSYYTHGTQQEPSALVANTSIRARLAKLTAQLADIPRPTAA